MRKASETGATDEKQHSRFAWKGLARGALSTATAARALIRRIDVFRAVTAVGSARVPKEQEAA
jgi:hypothetical protein